MESARQLTCRAFFACLWMLATAMMPLMKIAIEARIKSDPSPGSLAATAN
jgi:hypothetical protein